MVVFFILSIFIRVFSPRIVQLLSSRSFNPHDVIILFSFTRGTMSHTVPIHARSKISSLKSISIFAHIPCMSLNTTPHPDNSVNLLSFSSLGFNIIFAFGRLLLSGS